MTAGNSTRGHPLAPPPFFFHGQAVHLLLLVLLVGSAWVLADFSHLGSRSLWSVHGQAWFVVALFLPVLHQVFVWLAWRSELCFGTWTRWFDRRGFLIYQFVFFSFFLLRPVSLLLLTIADHDSVEIPIWLRLVICFVLCVPAVYTGYSVVRYFGMSRASGGDHFEERYRKMALVKKGIFRFTSNAMYSFAFLFFWAIAVAGASSSALLVAAFSHLYIWVHYFCTERPDMRVIYGQTPGA